MDSKRDRKIGLLLIGSVIAVIVMFCLLTSCAAPGNDNYSDVVVKYDTAQFTVMNDSIAKHEPSGQFYRKGRAVNGTTRWYREH